MCLTNGNQGSLVQSDPIGAPVVEAATLLANQLQRILNFEEFQKQTGAKLAALEKRLNRTILLIILLMQSLAPLVTYFFFF